MMYLILNHATKIATLKNSQNQIIYKIYRFNIVSEEFGSIIFNNTISIWWPKDGIVIHKYK